MRATARVAGPRVELAASGEEPERSERATVLGEATAVLRGELPPGTRVEGPAVCALPEATLAVPRGLERDRSTTTGRWCSIDPVELQVATGALRAACEEMGAVLVRAAHSANIKERRDCSTALFDPAGQMVMQAEHIPVHLGAMPAAVRAVVGEEHAEGVPWILNDPFAGGTHLPDITVITPVFARKKGDGPLACIGFAASRAHHADVGGRIPGSMPADSTTLDEEGVVIAPQPLTPELVDELAGRMRQPQQRRADLRAQVAANALGARRLAELAERLGPDRLAEATEEVIAYAERRTRAQLARMEDGVREATDVLEAARRRPRAAAAGGGPRRRAHPRLLRAARRSTAATSTARSR